MTERRTQNSILFLTTLGVYLGLVLVGATPVLGHAATTRNFELLDEIEFKDELDKKPDGCDAARTNEEMRELEAEYLWFNQGSIGEFRSLVELFLDAYPESRYATSEFTWSTADQERPFRKASFSGPPTLDPDTATSLDREFLEVANGLPGGGTSFSVLRLSGDTTFSLESRNFQYDSPLVRYLYSNALDLFKCGKYPALADLIYEKTQVVVENNSLIISTRLPRGSLDSLLANDAK